MTSATRLSAKASAWLTHQRTNPRARQPSQRICPQLAMSSTEAIADGLLKFNDLAATMATNRGRHGVDAKKTARLTHFGHCQVINISTHGHDHACGSRKLDPAGFARADSGCGRAPF